MTFDKVATFRNNMNKNWFLNETGLVFVHGDVFQDGPRNSATFKIGTLCNNW